MVCYVRFGRMRGWAKGKVHPNYILYMLFCRMHVQNLITCLFKWAHRIASFCARCIDETAGLYISRRRGEGKRLNPEIGLLL